MNGSDIFNEVLAEVAATLVEGDRLGRTPSEYSDHVARYLRSLFTDLPTEAQVAVVTELFGWERAGVRDTRDGLLHVCDFDGDDQPEPADEIVYAPRAEHPEETP